MLTFDELNYVPLYTHKPSRSRMLSVKTTGRPRQFYMVNELRPLDQPIVARGILNKDGTELHTTYIMPDGVQGSYSYDYQALKLAIAHYESLDEIKDKR
jgi:hypothetical protein